MLPYVAMVAIWQGMMELTNENLSLLWGRVPQHHRILPEDEDWSGTERVPEVREPFE